MELQDPPVSLTTTLRPPRSRGEDAVSSPINFFLKLLSLVELVMKINLWFDWTKLLSDLFKTDVDTRYVPLTQLPINLQLFF